MQQATQLVRSARLLPTQWRNTKDEATQSCPEFDEPTYQLDDANS